jgi:hypothetical protein
MERIQRITEIGITARATTQVLGAPTVQNRPRLVYRFDDFV